MAIIRTPEGNFDDGFGKFLPAVNGVITGFKIGPTQAIHVSQIPEDGIVELVDGRYVHIEFNENRQPIRVTEVEPAEA